jgi:hypothetical protein
MDYLSRRGAPMENLAHSASFESLNRDDAPSKGGPNTYPRVTLALTVIFSIEAIRLFLSKL